MNITIAKYAGACYGVNRSIDMLVSACSEYNKVATLGELIHNPKTVAMLRDKYGVEVVDSVVAAKSTKVDAIVIRSHGVSCSIDDDLQKSGLQVIDATCPHVKHVQKTASELAGKYDCVLVIGRKGHPEVEGVLSYIERTGSTGVCVNSAAEFEKTLPKIFTHKDGIGVVSQTTQSQDVYTEIIGLLDDSKIKYDAVNTICAATSKRQNAALEASKSADIVLVLGGKNSSNTAHLAEICARECKNVYLIDGVCDLQAQNITIPHNTNVVICAGASTPENQILKLKNFLKKSDNINL